MRKLLMLLATTGALSAPLAAHAQLNFDFSFGDSTGTVTGEIFGLTDNATSAPSDIVITSYSVALTGLPAAPWDIYTIPGYEFGNHGTSQLADHFTVTNGAITAATYSLFTATEQPVLYFDWGGLDVFGNHPDVGAILIVADPSTAIFTQVNGGVPEPAAWALTIGGLFGVGAMLRRRAAEAARA